jgi:hypothetical protein
VVLAAALFAACSSPERQLSQHREKLTSLATSARGVADAWLTGRVTTRYACTAWSQIFVLVERERRSLGEAPSLQAMPAGADLAREATRLSAALAALIEQAKRGDAASVRSREVELSL